MKTKITYTGLLLIAAVILFNIYKADYTNAPIASNNRTTNKDLNSAEKETTFELQKLTPITTSPDKIKNEIRILAENYNPDESNSSANLAVLQNLKNIITLGDNSDAATQALYAYSRLGNFDDTRTMLEYGKNKGLIDQRGYYSELVRMLPGLENNETEFKKILQEIIQGNDSYAFEVLINDIPSFNEIFYKSKEVQLTLNTYLLENKPVFQSHMADLGFSDLFNYDHWLRSLAKINAPNKNYETYYANYINNDLNDPREAVAIYAEGIFDSLPEALYSKERKKVKDFAMGYAKSYNGAVAKDVMGLENE